MHPCGIVADFREMYVEESKLRVYAVMEDLWHYPHQAARRVGHNDACQFRDCLAKTSEEGSEDARKLLNQLHLLIAAFHVEGHVRPLCKTKIHPGLRPWVSELHALSSKRGATSTCTGVASTFKPW